MSSMSRSARNRAAARARQSNTVPRGTIQSNRPPVMPSDQHLAIQVAPNDRIRIGRIRYSGSGADGYRSDWSRPADLRDRITLDSRWSATVSDFRPR